MLRIFMGRAGSGKTGKVMDEICSYIGKEQKNLILVVPEQYSHDAERLLCEKGGDSAAMYAQVLSFTRMCNRVFSELGGIANNYLDDAGKLLVMSRAVELSSLDTKVYGKLSKRSEYIARLTETAKEFRSSKISVADILEVAAASRSGLKDKLNDIAVIFQIYQSLMQNEVRDPDERLDMLAELVADASFTETGRFWFDGFYDFTQQQYSVIEKLIANASDVTVCLNCDDIYSDDPLFESSRNTAKKLISIAEELGKEYEIIAFDNTMSKKPEELKHIERCLFSSVADDYDGECKAVSAFSCKSISEECEFAAAKALELVQRGARWKDIAVAVGGFEEYTATLLTVFNKYGVPVYCNSKLDILNMPPVLAVISALKIITGGWSYEDVFTYLKTGVVSISRDDCDVLENYALMWNIRGSLWYRDEPWTFSQGGYKSGADEGILEKINEIRRVVVKPLIFLQNKMKQALTNAERLTALCDFMDMINLAEYIEAKAVSFAERGDRYMSECYVNLGEIITAAIEQFYSVASEFSINNDEFIYQLQMLFSKYDLGVIPTSVDSIAVGDISRLRKRGVKHLFILGMNENNVPAVSVSDGIFSDAERDELILNNLSIAQSSLQRLYGDITAVYDVLTMAEESLMLVYSSADTKGEVLKPSYILENIAAMLKIDIKTVLLSDYKIFAHKPCVEYAAAYSNADAAAAAAAELFSDDEYYLGLIDAADEMAGLHRKTLTAESAKKLYGDKITMTASRVDKYKSCKYAFFLQYGLKAKPRSKAEFDASVIGTFMHYILENVTREVEENGGFAKASEQDCTRITQKYVKLFVETELQDMKDKSARFQYLFESLCADAVSIVLNMAAELRNSDFRPLDFELDFSRDGQLPPYEIKDENISLAVRGVVDRVDGWIHEDKLYIRVVDYKTGVKSFNLSDVWYGMGIQMLIYMFALKSMGKDYYDMEIVPAGVLYEPAREVLLSESRHISDAELEKNRMKSLKRSGLILNDEDVIEAMEHGDNKIYLPVKTTKDGGFSGESLASAQQFGMLAKHIDKVLLEISRELFSGDVSADPYYRSQIDNSCVYCDYYHACHYDESTDGKYRSLTKLKTPEVWMNLQKECEK